MKNKILNHGYQIVILSAVHFHHILRGRTGAFVSWFLKLGCKIIFVEPSISLFRYFWDRHSYQKGFFFSLLRRIKKEKNLTIVSSLPVLPLGGYLRGVRVLNKCFLFIQFKIIFKIAKIKQEKLIFIATNPWWYQLKQLWKDSFFCYDCIDDVKVFSGPSSLKAKLYEKWHIRLIKEANLIFTCALTLKKEILSVNPQAKVFYISNGVDVKWFKKQVTLSPIPEDLKEIKKPIVGYIGAISHWVDIDLLSYCSKELHWLSFVIVGPSYTSEVKKLYPLSNVYLLGKKPYTKVPSYINSFDVCLLPFKVDDIGNKADPIKIYEYLALGKPVVSTNIKELQKLKDKIYIAREREDFVKSIKMALKEGNSLKKTRVEYAVENSWENQVKKMLYYLSKNV